VSECRHSSSPPEPFACTRPNPAVPGGPPPDPPADPPTDPPDVEPPEPDPIVWPPAAGKLAAGLVSRVCPLSEAGKVKQDASVGLSGATPVTLATLVITLPSAFLVHATAAFDFYANGSVNTKCEGRLLVDSVEASGRAVKTHVASNDRATVAQSWVLALGAGQHVLKLQGLKTEGDGTPTSEANTQLTLITTTSIIVAKRKLRLPPGSDAFDEVCYTDPADCCDTDGDAGDQDAITVSESTADGGGSGTDVTVGCCPVAVPATLQVTLTNVSGCAALAGTYSVVWNGSAWTYSGTVGGKAFALSLNCDVGDVWRLAITSGGMTPIFTPNTVVCDPLLLTDWPAGSFAFLEPSAACTGEVSVVVTV
jgi:hypothetical protein